MLDSIQTNRLAILKAQGTLNQTEILELRQLEALNGLVPVDLGPNLVQTKEQNIIQSADQKPAAKEIILEPVEVETPAAEEVTEVKTEEPIV